MVLGIGSSQPACCRSLIRQVGRQSKQIESLERKVDRQKGIILSQKETLKEQKSEIKRREWLPWYFPVVVIPLGLFLLVKEEIFDFKLAADSLQGHETVGPPRKRTWIF